MTARAALLPANASAFEIAESSTSARLLEADTNIIRRERDAMQCDARFLPFLAWERSTHHWTGTKVAPDRAAVDNSFADHIAYGSPAALEAEIAADIGSAVVIREYFECGREWPDFEITIAVLDDAPPPPTPDLVWSSVVGRQRKNVRDWPIIVYTAGERGPLVIAAAVHVAGTYTVKPFDPTPRFLGPLAYGVAVRVVGNINVRPYSA
jgi:phage tail P2-like protein